MKVRETRDQVLILRAKIMIPDVFIEHLLCCAQYMVLFPLKGTEKLSHFFRVTQPVNSWLQTPSSREEAVSGDSLHVNLAYSGGSRF